MYKVGKHGFSGQLGFVLGALLKKLQISANYNFPFLFARKENHLWDVFRVTSEDNISDSDLAIWRTIFIITKIIIVFLFFVIVLGTAVITKITFLIMTSNIYVPSQTKDVNFTSDGPYKIKELDGKLTYKQADGEAKIEVTWIWALITVMSAPYFFTICKCLWKLCFNKTRSLKIIPLLVVCRVYYLTHVNFCD